MVMIKIIAGVVGGVILLFGLALGFALLPKVRNVSADKQLNVFLNKPLVLKKNVFVDDCSAGTHRFSPYELNTGEQHSCERKYNLAIGTPILLTSFNTYKNNVGEGTTTLFALGETQLPDGKKIEFEYSWEDVNQPLEKKSFIDLPQAPWQDNTDEIVRYNIK